MSDELKSAAEPLPRALRWWSPTALLVLSRELDRIWQAWALRWELSVQPLVVFNAHEAKVSLPTDAWQACTDGAASTHPWGWAGATGGEVCRPLVEAMFGASSGTAVTRQSSSLAQGVAEKAWAEFEDELLRLLSSAAGGRDAPPASALPRVLPWSGDVRVLLPMGTTDIWLHLSAHRVAPLLDGKRRKWSGKLAPIESSVLAAIANRPFSLRVEFTPTELDLGSLQSLRVGDVLTLSHALDAPLTVHTSHPDGMPSRAVCSGYLGARHGQRAIELVPGVLA